MEMISIDTTAWLPIFVERARYLSARIHRQRHEVDERGARVAQVGEEILLGALLNFFGIGERLGVSHEGIDCALDDLFVLWRRGFARCRCFEVERPGMHFAAKR